MRLWYTVSEHPFSWDASIMCLSLQHCGRHTAFLFNLSEPFGIAGSSSACHNGTGTAVTSHLVFMFVITECNSRAPQHGTCLSSWQTNGQCILHKERTVFINKQFPFHYILMCSQLLRKFLEILDIQHTTSFHTITTYHSYIQNSAYCSHRHSFLSSVYQFSFSIHSFHLWIQCH